MKSVVALMVSAALTASAVASRYDGWESDNSFALWIPIGMAIFAGQRWGKWSAIIAGVGGLALLFVLPHAVVGVMIAALVVLFVFVIVTS